MNKEIKYALIGFVLGIFVTLLLTSGGSNPNELTKIIPAKDISVDNFINNSNSQGNLKGL